MKESEKFWKALKKKKKRQIMRIIERSWIECSPMLLGDLGSIPGRVIPKTLKMVQDASLLNTQQYKVRIKGKVEQSRKRSSAFPYTLV